MNLGIRPTVDFVFKLLFGSPERTAITVHFLNAVLQCTPRIERVEILNPMLLPETDDDKLAILDVLAIDGAGRRFNIEMQSSIPAGLSQRLVYYASSLYVDQLGEGEDYVALRPVISICVLERPLLSDTHDLHSDFRLRSTAGRILSDDLQIHLIELSKSRATRDNIDKSDALERWSYFLAQADRYSAEELRVLLPEPTFDAAIGVLEMIARNPEQRLAYDARLKLQRDEAARIAYAREEGREEGRDEGELIGAVRVLEMILGLPLTDKDVLSRIDKAMLESRIEAMQRQIRERGPNRSDA